jgi:hypothetical protein
MLVALVIAAALIGTEQFRSRDDLNAGAQEIEVRGRRKRLDRAPERRIQHHGRAPAHRLLRGPNAAVGLFMSLGRVLPGRYPATDSVDTYIGAEVI